MYNATIYIRPNTTAYITKEALPPSAAIVGVSDVVTLYYNVENLSEYNLNPKPTEMTVTRYLFANSTAAILIGQNQGLETVVVKLIDNAGCMGNAAVSFLVTNQQERMNYPPWKIVSLSNVSVNYNVAFNFTGALDELYELLITFIAVNQEQPYSSSQLTKLNTTRTPTGQDVVTPVDKQTLLQCVYQVNITISSYTYEIDSSGFKALIVPGDPMAKGLTGPLAIISNSQLSTVTSVEFLTGAANYQRIGFYQLLCLTIFCALVTIIVLLVYVSRNVRRNILAAKSSTTLSAIPLISNPKIE